MTFRNSDSLEPLSLYIHTPWCEKKCPYCDFNSHESTPEEIDYLEAVKQDLSYDALWLAIHRTMARPVNSVFIGGGTPSLLSGYFYKKLFQHLRVYLRFTDDCEITIEANPGTVDAKHFEGYREAGINRISIGAQSFDNRQLKKLGRIHDVSQIRKAVKTARNVGFDNINLDVMFGLPEQNQEQALVDIKKAMALEPEHFSWYQLTIEPNTIFSKHPPQVPKDDDLYEMFTAGRELLASHGFSPYEVSAYSKSDALQCRHNLNYWNYGDYLALGAGAHGKVSLRSDVWRYQKTRMPKDYLTRIGSRTSDKTKPNQQTRLFEYLLNRLRLPNVVITREHIENHGRVPFSVLRDKIEHHKWLGQFFELGGATCQLTPDGFMQLNNVLGEFLE